MKMKQRIKKHLKRINAEITCDPFIVGTAVIWAILFAMMLWS